MRKSRSEGKISNFEELKTFILQERVLNRFGLQKIGVFGSFARGESSYQDIDFFIDEVLPYKQLIALNHFLEKQLKTKIDLMEQRFAEPLILYHALKEMKYVASES